MDDQLVQEFVQRWTKAVDAPVRENNRVDWLVDGWATFSSMYSAIQTCLSGETKNYYVYLLGWWLDETLRLKGDDAKSELFVLLSNLADKGVQIRVMLYDNFLKGLYSAIYGAGTKPNHPALIPWEQVDAINRMKGAQAILDGHTVPRYFQSHHHKLLLLRGKSGLIGFCGGVDLAFDRIVSVKKHPGSPFHDVHCRIEGPAVKDLIDVFVQRWSAHPAGAKTKHELRALSDVPPVRGQNGQKGPGNARVGIVRTFVRPEGPCIVEKSFATTLLNSITAARHFIYCEDQYMVSLDVAKAIGKQMSSGLQFVFFLIPHSSISDLPGVWPARAKFISTVLENTKGEKNRNKFHVFYKLRSKQFDDVKEQKPLREALSHAPHQPPTMEEVPKEGDFGLHTYIHSKTWVFDDEMAIIGTANVNRRGLYFDSEVAAAIFDVPPLLVQGRLSFAQQLRMQLWSEHLGVPLAQVRSPLVRETQMLWFAKEVQRYVRHYRQDDEDPESASGWYIPNRLAPPKRPEDSPLQQTEELTADQTTSAWNFLSDPMGPETLKPCSS